MKKMQENSKYNGKSVFTKSDFKKGDKVITRDGNIETVLRINSNGNIETKENNYSWPPYTLKPSLAMLIRISTGEIVARGLTRFEVSHLLRKVKNKSDFRTEPDPGPPGKDDYIKLFNLAKGDCLQSYEMFLNNKFGGYLYPHLREAMYKAENAEQFAAMVIRFERGI